MTDRRMTCTEAIRRLAEIVDTMYRAAARHGNPDIRALLDDLAEPSAPTDEFQRGYNELFRAAPAAPTVTATGTDCGNPVTHSCSAPTVTQEYAARLYAAVRFGWPFDFQIPTDDEIPAFLRAVALVLEGK